MGEDGSSYKLVLMLEDREVPFALNNGDTMVGATSPADEIFPDIDLDSFDDDKVVSRRHAKIVVDGDKVTIEDLGSTNGTQVGGEGLASGEAKQIAEGDEIVFATRFKSKIVAGAGGDDGDGGDSDGGGDEDGGDDAGGDDASAAESSD